jgi:ABC-type Fe3+-hydroxamate transport system substrate-binding protein
MPPHRPRLEVGLPARSAVVIEVVDALGRTVRLAAPARRIVSLVPSETESVIALAGAGVLVGRSDYCIAPRDAVASLPTCGGTKSIDVDAVVALRPDLVLVNQEENAKKEVERLIDAGLTVHVSFPHDVSAALAWLESLARLLDTPDAPALAATRAAVREAFAIAGRREGPLRRVFVPIWMDPLMTFDGRTFASDVLELAGAANVFADRPRRYPLAADLGTAAPLSPERTEGRDTRYPRVTVEEVVARAPEAVLLPSEPHDFTEADAEVFRALPIPAAARDAVRFADGMDLFWYGTRLAESLKRLRAFVAALPDA